MCTSEEKVRRDLETQSKSRVNIFWTEMYRDVLWEKILTPQGSFSRTAKTTPVHYFRFSSLCAETLHRRGEREGTQNVQERQGSAHRGAWKNKCLYPKENSTQDDKQPLSCRKAEAALVLRYITASCSRPPQTLTTIQGLFIRKLRWWRVSAASGGRPTWHFTKV